MQRTQSRTAARNAMSSISEQASREEERERLCRAVVPALPDGRRSIDRQSASITSRTAGSQTQPPAHNVFNSLLGLGGRLAGATEGECKCECSDKRAQGQRNAYPPMTRHSTTDAAALPLSSGGSATRGNGDIGVHMALIDGAVRDSPASGAHRNRSVDVREALEATWKPIGRPAIESERALMGHPTSLGPYTDVGECCVTD